MAEVRATETPALRIVDEGGAQRVRAVALVPGPDGAQWLVGAVDQAEPSPQEARVSLSSA